MAESLLLPLVQRRSTNGLSRKTMLKIPLLMPTENVQDDDEQRLPTSKNDAANSSKRVVGKTGYKFKKDCL